MERLVLELGVMFIVYVIGYRMGYVACFNYLLGELKEHMNESDYK